MPPSPADAQHFRRQAELCERLLSGLHQADLVEVLGRLHEEYEAAAARIEAEAGADSETAGESSEE